MEMLSAPIGPEPAQADPDLEEALQEYQAALAHIQGLGIKPLSPSLKALIWGLRLYVVFMAIVVVFNVIQTLH